MSLYRFEASIVSRKKGQSAIARAAYNSRSKLVDEKTGETKDYRYKGGVEFEGIFAPKNAPDWVHNRQELWNRVEQAERRGDAQLAKDFKLALPWELNKEQREWLVKDFAREMSRRGMVVDAAIHEPEDRKSDERNYHVHILCTTRDIGPDGFGKKNREWNTREELEGWRERWAKLGARHLEKAGHKLEAQRYGVAHKTLDKQREAAVNRGDWDAAKMLDREPTKHLGPNATAMERRGLITRKGDENREIEGRNFARQNGFRIPPRLGNVAARAMGSTLDMVSSALNAFAPVLSRKQKWEGRVADQNKEIASDREEKRRQQERERSYDRDR